MSDRTIISSDQPLAKEQREVFSALLDTLVPASDDGVMPSAAELDLIGYLKEKAPELVPQLAAIVGCFAADFAKLPYTERYELVSGFAGKQPQLFESLLFHTYACYYQDDRVLVGIGSKAGPPFPQGNTVEAGDLSLLDPVVKLQRGYRKP